MREAPNDFFDTAKICLLDTDYQKAPGFKKNQGLDIRTVDIRESSLRTRFSC